MKRVLAWAPVALLAALVAIFAFELATGEPTQQSPLLDSEAPIFTLDSVDDGAPFSLGDTRGQITVINFWASWCPPCRDEHPALVAVANTYPDAQFIGITHQDDPDASRGFLDEYGRADQAVYLEDPGSAVGIQYGIFGLPETFFLDEDGVVVGKITGPATIGTLLAMMEAIESGERPGLVIAGEVQAVPGS